MLAVSAVCLRAGRNVRSRAELRGLRHQAARALDVVDGVGAFVRRSASQQLFLAVNQAAGIECGQLESVSVGDGVSGAGFHAVAAEDAAIVIDVVNLGVALGAADAAGLGVLRRFDVNAVRGARGRTQEARHALFQPVLVALQYVHAAEALLEHGAAIGAWTVGIVFDLRGLKDRKSTRLNSSHRCISYAVFCLKKKRKTY